MKHLQEALPWSQPLEGALLQLSPHQEPIKTGRTRPSDVSKEHNKSEDTQPIVPLEPTEGHRNILNEGVGFPRSEIEGDVPFGSLEEFLALALLAEEICTQ